MRSLLTAARLTPAEWREFLRAYAALLIAQYLVWRRPVGQFVSMSYPSVDPADRADLERYRANAAAGERLAEGIRRAARLNPFRPRCLVRSVALQRLLESHGITGSRICIGVRRRDGTLEAHAWVEYAGRILGDENAHVFTYTPVGDAQLVSTFRL
jgi:hypothetical protein